MYRGQCGVTGQCACVSTIDTCIEDSAQVLDSVCSCPLCGHAGQDSVSEQDRSACVQYVCMCPGQMSYSWACSRLHCACMFGHAMCFSSVAMQNTITWLSENFTVCVCGAVALLFAVLCLV